MDLGENLNDTLKGIIADVRLTQPTYWYAIITAYIAIALRACHNTFYYVKQLRMRMPICTMTILLVVQYTQ